MSQSGGTPGEDDELQDALYWYTRRKWEAEHSGQEWLYASSLGRRNRYQRNQELKSWVSWERFWAVVVGCLILGGGIGYWIGSAERVEVSCVQLVSGRLDCSHEVREAGAGEGVSSDGGRRVALVQSVGGDRSVEDGIGWGMVAIAGLGFGLVGFMSGLICGAWWAGPRKR